MAQKEIQKIGRRDFLTKGLIASAGVLSMKSLLVPKALGATSLFQNQQIEQADCLVLGAGMSGLCAARNLAFPKDHSPFKVIVLEASGGIGGRIFSINDPRFGKPMELGAQYIHRKPGSVDLWEDLNRYDVQLKKVPRMLRGLMYVPGVRRPKSKEYMLPFKWNFKDILTFSKKIDSYRGPDISAKEWLDRQDYNHIGRGLVDLYFTGSMPGKLENMSVKGFASDKASLQEMEWYEYQIHGGFLSFIERFTFSDDYSKKLDIRYQSIVEQIKYGPDGVEIRVKGGKSYKAKTAIITFSVGVLKSGMIEFIPPLPKSKMDALECLGMGDEVKIILKFKKCFWGEKTAILNSINTKRKTCRTFLIPGSGKKGEENTILNALFAGEEADDIYGKSDESVISDICSDLSEIFPNEGPIDQLLVQDSFGEYQYLRMQWRDNPYTLGADSFLKAHSERSVPIEKVREKLASAHETPSLFWAGEATASGDGIQPASTHGAHFAGNRASKEVLSHLLS
ncbi:MAG: NAD(P)/FAD-dependent oxidoreductase [Bacteriovorax sp.]|nr:NAD(P)/FAD-dependent oxidoreductase [Bacteriovorax sp.]